MTDRPEDGLRWQDLLAEAERTDKTYHDKCDSIDCLYADLEKLSNTTRDRQFQIFWANMEVLRPSIYAQAPVPVVRPRFPDRRDLPRKAADVMERALLADVEADALHDTLLLVRDDLALSGRGVPWVQMADRDGIEVPICRHIDRKDFRHGPARKWQEVPWVAKREWLTRQQFEKRFKTVPEGVAFENRKLGTDVDTTVKKAGVWEIWHKEEGVVVFVAECASREHYLNSVLDKREPWLNLTGFFPCPRPAYSTLKRATLTPIPDFVYYKDQVEEINELTGRIAALTQALQVRGYYAAGTPEIGEAIEKALKSSDNRALLVPISSYAALGGAALKDSIVWLPVKEIAEVVVQCIELRRQLIQDVYEITGLSDIMRGATEAEETATAQQLKAQYGSVRIRERQAEMVRIARDIIRMKAEIMAEEMEVSTLLEMSQVDDIPSAVELEQQAAPLIQQAQAQLEQLAMAGTPEADEQAAQIEQQVQQQLQQLQQTVTQEAIGELYKNQRLRPFILDIETDSTVYPDENAEKQRRVEFMGALAPLLQQGVSAMQLAPQLGAFVAESIRFVASGFRAGRQMDEAIDELAEQFANYQPPQEGGGEAEQAKLEMERVKAEADAQAAQAKLQLETQKIQAEVAAKTQEMQIAQQELGIKSQETSAKVDLMAAQVQEILARINIERERVAVEREKVQTDARLGEGKLGLEGQRLQSDATIAREQMSVAERTKDKELSVAERTKAAELSQAEKAKSVDASLAERKLSSEEKRSEREFSAKKAEKPEAPKPRKVRTRVVKHDDKGRIAEVEQEEYD